MWQSKVGGREPVVLLAALGLTICCTWLLHDNDLLGVARLQARLCGTGEDAPGERSMAETAVPPATRLQLPAATAAASGLAAPVPPMRRIFVVAAGHSGTSLMLRTLGNLPGLLCIEKESFLFDLHQNETGYQSMMFDKWDGLAAKHQYQGWVEKTPKHALYLGDIFRVDPHAKVVFLIRDGREVTASWHQGGKAFNYSWDRWVAANTAVLPYLESPQVLTVKFEEFVDASKVLGVLQQLAGFVGAEATPGRLLLALQPASKPLEVDVQCQAYASEAEKHADLAASYLASMAAGSLLGSSAAEPARQHNNLLRSWQMSQGWAPVAPGRWNESLDAKEQAALAANQPFQDLMARFGYT